MSKKTLDCHRYSLWIMSSDNNVGKCEFISLLPSVLNNLDSFACSIGSFSLMMPIKLSLGNTINSCCVVVLGGDARKNVLCWACTQNKL